MDDTLFDMPTVRESADVRRERNRAYAAHLADYMPRYYSAQAARCAAQGDTHGSRAYQARADAARAFWRGGAGG